MPFCMTTSPFLDAHLQEEVGTGPDNESQMKCIPKSRWRGAAARLLPLPLPLLPLPPMRLGSSKCKFADPIVECRRLPAARTQVGCRGCASCPWTVPPTIASFVSSHIANSLVVKLVKRKRYALCELWRGGCGCDDRSPLGYAQINVMIPPPMQQRRTEEADN